MMQLKRLAMLGMLSLLGACGSESPLENAPAGPVTIELQAFGDPAEVAAYRELISAFEAATPDVRVQLIPIGKQADHMAKLATAFAAKSPPDLFLINYRRYGQFASRGVLEPLGPRLTERGKFKEEDFYPQTIEAFRFGDVLQCAPQNVSSLVSYINTDLFAAAGLTPPGEKWSWAEFDAAAKALTRDADGDGRAETYGIGFEPTLIRLAPFIWQAGGEIVDDLHKPTQFTLETDAAKRALAQVHGWRLNGWAPPLIENKSEDHESRFARGALGMILHSRRYTATLREVSGLNWDVAPLPSDVKEATVLHADAYCMAAASSKKDAAYRFIEFALGTEGAGIVARSGRTVPARRSVAESPVFLDPELPPRSAKVFLDSLSRMQRTPNIARWNEVETRVDPLVEEWYFGPENPPKSLDEDITDSITGLFDE